MTDEKQTQEQADEEMINQGFQELLDSYLATKHRKKVEIITKAFNFAKQAHKGVKRRSGEPYIMHPIAVAKIVCTEIGLGSTSICSALLHDVVEDTDYTVEDIENLFGPKIAQIVDGLTKISGGIFGDRASAQAENFKKLLLTMSDDIRVILIKIADRLHNMRTLGSMLPNKQYKIAGETLYIYAPLANRLGLNKIKTELEDLSFKYEHPEEYAQIESKLQETQAEREEVFREFTAPIRAQLDKMGISYQLIARVKSPYSIWNKMKKQNADIKDIYDLFAIRIIIRTPKEKEHQDCWAAFAIVTNMYRGNPSRMKDWITIPKSNGYESLHTTVYGPDNRWVEVQIRTQRMDEIAEKGVAAHWKYKGLHSEKSLDEWMANVRDLLETSGKDAPALIRQMNMDVYNKEVFIFTPKGDLHKLPLGATVLDFAFAIHSQVGCTCIGGKVNGRNQKINYVLHSGDTVEILTSSTQFPKLQWLSFIVTAKARNKIRQLLNETNNTSVEYAKEMLQRRFKNRKIEIDESVLMKMIKKMGYKTVTDFYNDVANEKIDMASIVDNYIGMVEKEKESAYINRSAQDFVLQPHESEKEAKSDDIVRIGEGIRNINYKLSKCCNPIQGDAIMGFISSDGAIKIHKKECPNAIHLTRRYPYRTIRAAWSDKVGENQFAVTLEIVGNDDIGIVNTLTSIITKEKNVSLRSIAIDSNDGLFNGRIVIGVNDSTSLNNVIKKIKTIKGLKDVRRIK